MKLNYFLIVAVSIYIGTFLCQNANAQSQGCDSLETIYIQNANNTGCMFSVVAKADITIDHMYSNLYSYAPPYDTAQYKLFYKKGTYVGFEKSAGSWTFLDNMVIKGALSNVPILVPYNMNFSLAKNDTISFYITEPKGYGRTFVTKDTAKSGTIISNNSISILPAALIYGLFKTATPNYIWNGTVVYCQGLGNTVGVSEMAHNNENDITVFSSNGQLQIQTAQKIIDQHIQVCLYDLFSREVMVQNINAVQQTINTSSISKGIYICTIKSNNRILQQKKIIVE